MKYFNSEDSRCDILTSVPRSSRLAVVFGSLLCFLTLVFATTVNALEIDPEKAIVLVSGYNHEENSDVEQFIFQNTESDTQFRVKPYGRIVREVTPGTYFLSRITAFGASPLRISPPTDKIGTIVILKGSITYIGDWGASVNMMVFPRIFDWDVSYEFDTIRDFGRQHPEFKDLKLNIATDIGEIQQVEWNAILD